MEEFQIELIGRFVVFREKLTVEVQDKLRVNLRVDLRVKSDVVTVSRLMEVSLCIFDFQQ